MAPQGTLNPSQDKSAEFRPKWAHGLLCVTISQR